MKEFAMPRKDLISYPKKRGYRFHPGMVAWLFHRVSGVIIGFFLIFHMLGISGVCTFMGDVVKNHYVMAFVSLLFVLHAANGVRIILMEFCSSADRNKFLAHLTVTTVIIAVIGLAFVIKFWIKE
jgi:succinate dehydrogenase / fumarate reductase cytochrome b subunit